MYININININCFITKYSYFGFPLIKITGELETKSFGKEERDLVLQI